MKCFTYWISDVIENLAFDASMTRDWAILPEVASYEIGCLFTNFTHTSSTLNFLRHLTLSFRETVKQKGIQTYIMFAIRY